MKSKHSYYYKHGQALYQANKAKGYITYAIQGPKEMIAQIKSFVRQYKIDNKMYLRSPNKLKDEE